MRYLIVLAALLLTLQLKAGEALPGSAAFKPTPEHPVGWRGDGTGQYPGATPPINWSRTIADGKPQSSGMLWMTPIPAGASSPIVVGDKIFLGFDPYGLLCVNKIDGKILWYRTHNYYEVMPEDQRKTIEATANPPFLKIKTAMDAEIKRMSDSVSVAGFPNEKRFMNWQWSQQFNEPKKIIDNAVLELDKAKYKTYKDYWEWASATPISDGKFVYMWYSNRIAVCYDLEGNRQWVTMEPGVEKRFGEHGRHASPVLAGDKFVVQYANDIMAFDKKTGKLAWTKSYNKTVPWAPPAYASIVPAYVNGQAYAVTCRGEGYRVSDGELGWGYFKDYGGENTSAIVEKDRIFLWDRAGLIQLQIPANPGPNAQPTVGKSLKAKLYMVASPLFVNGLVYHICNDGPLRVMDAETGALVYEKQLPLKLHREYVFYPGYAASPALAGKYIYIMDNQGGTVVLEPGREYKEVAVNKIEMFDRKAKSKEGVEESVYEQFVSNPAFDGKLMFIRGQMYLYCVSAK